MNTANTRSHYKNFYRSRQKRFEPSKVKIADVIPKMSMGDRNTIYELQNYVVGLGPNGIVLNADGIAERGTEFCAHRLFLTAS